MVELIATVAHNATSMMVIYYAGARMNMAAGSMQRLIPQPAVMESIMLMERLNVEVAEVFAS